MATKRTPEKWDSQFQISKKIFEGIPELGKIGGTELIRDACVAYRNPVVFDNQVADACFKLPFYVPYDLGEKLTHDHLIGTSNIVLYIHRNKINERWTSYEDFIKTLKSLQVLLLMPKSLNDKGSFKNNWQFDYHNINNCIKWNDKLRREGIEFLISENNQFRSPIDDVWEEWYETFKEFL